MTKASDNVFPRFLISEGGSTATPAAGRVTVYAKADGLLYSKDDAGTEKLMSSGSVAGVGNLWTMNKSSSQTLTNNTLTQITFDTAVIDGGGSVIDLANDKFETPATGFYLVFFTWLWETTVPGVANAISVKVSTTESIAIVRGQAATASMAADRGNNGSGALSLTAGDDVTLWINPGAVTGVTARGNASVHLATTFTLVRIT